MTRPAGRPASWSWSPSAINMARRRFVSAIGPRRMSPSTSGAKGEPGGPQPVPKDAGDNQYDEIELRVGGGVGAADGQYQHHRHQQLGAQAQQTQDDRRHHPRR